MAASLAVLGARIRTMDPGRPWASAMAVTDGVITALGSDDEVRERCDATIEIEVLAGHERTITPGLTDGHQHLLMGAVVGRGIDFDRVADLEGIRAALAAGRRRLALRAGRAQRRGLAELSGVGWPTAPARRRASRLARGAERRLDASPRDGRDVAVVGAAAAAEDPRVGQQPEDPLVGIRKLLGISGIEFLGGVHLGVAAGGGVGP